MGTAEVGKKVTAWINPSCGGKDCNVDQSRSSLPDTNDSSDLLAGVKCSKRTA